MAISLFKRHYKLNNSGLYQGSDGVGSQPNQLVWPAALLALLFAMVVSAAFADSTQSSNSTGEHVQAPTVPAQLQASEDAGKSPEDLVAPVEDTQSGGSSETSSVSTQTTIINGQAEFEVKVNGQEIPVAPQGTTHRTIIDGTGQTQVDVNIQNGQTSSTTSTSGNGPVNSFSHSYQSTFFNEDTP